MGSPRTNKALGRTSFHLGTVEEKSKSLWEFGDDFEVQTLMTSFSEEHLTELSGQPQEDGRA